jgi:DNA repair photolyase
MAMAQPALFKDDRPNRSGPAAVRYRRSGAILNKGAGLLRWVDYSLNPYVGCQFGCSYCYAAFFQPDEAKVAAWGKWVEVKENALDLVRRARNLGGKLILIGSATDPYQPIEAKLGLTRSILEHLATLRPQPTPMIITRSPLAERDADVFLRFERLRVNVTVTTDDDEVRRAFEPGCPSIERRVEALGTLAAQGVFVGAGLSPLLPMRDPPGFLRRLRDIGVRRVSVNAFHRSSTPFASSTRDPALEIAARMGWTDEVAKRWVARMRADAERLFPEKAGCRTRIRT